MLRLRQCGPRWACDDRGQLGGAVGCRTPPRQSNRIVPSSDRVAAPHRAAPHRAKITHPERSIASRKNLRHNGEMVECNDNNSPSCQALLTGKDHQSEQANHNDTTKKAKITGPERSISSRINVRHIWTSCGCPGRSAAGRLRVGSAAFPPARRVLGGSPSRVPAHACWRPFGFAQGCPRTWLVRL